MAPLPLAGGVPGDPSLAMLAVLGLASVGAALLLGVAVGAVVRRRSRPYVLIAGAIGALLARSAVAWLEMTGTVSPTGHHLLEHGLDVVLVGLVVAAVYHARQVSTEVDSRS